MRFSKNQIQMADNLVKVSKFYKEGMNYSLNKYEKIFRGSGFEALKHFIEIYAYERQGSARAYRRIALDILNEKYGHNKWKVPTKEDAEELWEQYKIVAKRDYNLEGEGGNVKINEAVNPMNLNGGLIYLLSSINIQNLALYIKSKIEKKEIDEAYKNIESIRGIGNKITCFYLRDIADLIRTQDRFEFETEYEYDNLHRFQPIDTWLDQTGKIVFLKEWEKPHLTETRRLIEKQKLIVDLCKEAKLSSISFNQGAWVLGSTLAGNFSNFEKAVKSKEYIKTLIKEAIEYKRFEINILENTHEQFI